MIVLGLHKDPWHNTGAAMIRDDGDGPRIAYISEERLDRVKDSRAFPEQSVRACMRQLGVRSHQEIDVVVMDYIRTGNDWRADHFRTPCRRDVFLHDLPAERLHIVNHHLLHAYATFCTSPFERAAVLVVDGRGSDGETQSLFRAGPEGVTLLAKSDRIGVGLLYAAITQAIGFGLLQEGKTMGLAPYGAACDEPVLDLRGRFDGIHTDYSRLCAAGSYDLLVPHRPLTSFEDKARAAWEVQHECERAMLHLARVAREQTGERFLCLSGGVRYRYPAGGGTLWLSLLDEAAAPAARADTVSGAGVRHHDHHRCHRPVLRVSGSH